MSSDSARKCVCKKQYDTNKVIYVRILSTKWNCKYCNGTNYGAKERRTQCRHCSRW